MTKQKPKIDKTASPPAEGEIVEMWKQAVEATTPWWIRRCREKAEDLKDQEIADLLGIPRSAFSQYSTGKNTMGPYACIRVAEYIGEDPLTVIITVELEKALGKPQEKEWRRILRKKNRNEFYHHDIPLPSFLFDQPNEE